MSMKLPKFTKEQRFHLAKTLLSGGEWPWLKSELENQIKLMKPNIHTKKDEFTQGVIAGIEFCIEYPEKVKEEGDRFLNRMVEKVFGGS